MYSGKVSPTIADDIKKSSLGNLGSLIVVFYILLYDSRNGNFH